MRKVGSFIGDWWRLVVPYFKSEDWPFASERDALLLLLEQPNDPDPVASAWTDPEAKQIGIDLGWLKIRCGPLVPETGEVAS